MSRKRMLDPSIWTDPGFMELSTDGRLLYIGLVSHADDDGKGVGSVKCLKAEIFPSDDISIDLIQELVDSIQENMQVVFYGKNGKEYYKMLKWKSYQYVNHPHKSVIPDPPRNKTNVGTVREQYGTDTGTVQERSTQIDREIDREIDKGVSSTPPQKLKTKQLQALANKLKDSDPQSYKALLKQHPELEEEIPFNTKPP